MKHIFMCTTALAALLHFGVTAIAAEYEITVDIDETTGSDMDMVESFLETANDDSVASRSLRRILMGGSGELAAAADARFDDSGSLLLDDGSLVPFVDEDLLKVRRKLCLKRRFTDGQCGDATIIFDCKIIDKLLTHRKCQPTSVQVCPEAGGSIVAMIPPGQQKGGVEVCPPGRITKLCGKGCIHK